MNDAGHRVKTVSELTGIPRNTLVAWERRYNLLEPSRTEGGYRLYSDRDVAYLRQLKSLVDGGLAISEAIQRLKSTGPVAGGALWEQVLEPLLAFDRAGAGAALRKVGLLPFEEAIADVWMPMLREVGCAWEGGRISVAQEHFVAGVVREHLVTMYRSLDGGLGHGARTVCASFPGEMHDLPLLTVAVRLALRGYRVTWLGADLPLAELCVHVVRQRPDILCLSCINTVSSAAVLDVARQLRAAADPETRVVLGGPGVAGLEGHSTENLWFCPTFDEMLSRLG